MHGYIRRHLRLYIVLCIVIYVHIHGENFIVISPKLICESALNSILNGVEVENLEKFPIQYIKTQ